MSTLNAPGTPRPGEHHDHNLEQATSNSKGLFEDASMSDLLDRITSSNSDIKCRLAPSFGELTANSLREMDKEIQLLVAATVKALNDTVEELTWKTVNNIFRQNSMLEHNPRNDVSRHSMLPWTSKRRLFFPTIMKRSKWAGQKLLVDEEVEHWFATLVGSDDVLESTSIPLPFLKRIVASTGADAGLRGPDGVVRKNFLDISVLRFPDIDNPFVRVYRIKLSAWATCNRTLVTFSEKNSNGVRGEYASSDYYLRRNVIDRISPQILDQAVQEAEDFFTKWRSPILT